jgi:hypothetical protein
MRAAARRVRAAGPAPSPRPEAFLLAPFRLPGVLLRAMPQLRAQP